MKLCIQIAIIALALHLCSAVVERCMCIDDGSGTCKCGGPVVPLKPPPCPECPTKPFYRCACRRKSDNLILSPPPEAERPAYCTDCPPYPFAGRPCPIFDCDEQQEQTYLAPPSVPAPAVVDPPLVECPPCPEPSCPNPCPCLSSDDQKTLLVAPVAPERPDNCEKCPTICCKRLPCPDVAVICTPDQLSTYVAQTDPVAV